jgi:hypothetical protein
MKGLVVTGLVVLVLLLVVGGAYFLLRSPSQTRTASSTGQQQQQASSSTIFISISHSESTSQTTSSSHLQTTTTNGPAKVDVSAITCVAADGKCVGTLVNTGGTTVKTTGCIFNGQTGVFSSVGGQVPPGGSLDVTCGPAQGGAIPISGFHLEVIIQLSDGSSVKYAGNWQ